MYYFDVGHVIRQTMVLRAATVPLQSDRLGFETSRCYQATVLWRPNIRVISLVGPLYILFDMKPVLIYDIYRHIRGRSQLGYALSRNQNPIVLLVLFALGPTKPFLQSCFTPVASKQSTTLPACFICFEGFTRRTDQRNG
jgi:hypothetical protein